MLRAAVLGDPLSHSLSPKLHHYWLKELAIAGSYEAIHTSKDALADTLKRLQEEGFGGCNLTLPLKEAAFDCVDTISEEAEAIGAINTVLFKQGKTLGSNTDAYGFMENVKMSVAISHLICNIVLLLAQAARRRRCITV